MFKMKRNAIEMSIGDSCEFMITVPDYPIADDDKIVFTVDGLLSKEIDAEELYVKLVPEDTSNLTPGVYTYDVKFIRHDGEIYTIVERNLFILNAGVSAPQPEPEEE